MRSLIAAITIVVVGAAAAPAFAQTFTPGEQRAAIPARPQPYRIGFRAYVLADTSEIAAKDTFDAIFGTSSMTSIGAGAEVLNLYRGVFARVTWSSGSLDGSRVTLVNGDPIPLGIPLTVTMTPIEAGGGWRFRTKRSWLAPYLGASLVLMRYEETSEFALPAENVDESFTGYSVFGGIDFRVARWVVLGVEAQYRGIHAPADGGVAAEFGESELGGTTLRVLVGIGR